MQGSWVRLVAAVGLTAALVSVAKPALSFGGGGKKEAFRWSRAAGRPDIQVGRTKGFYIWTEGNTVFVVTTTQSEKPRTFAGSIDVRGGQIQDVKGIKKDRADKIKRKDRNSIEFSFETGEGMDGLQFTLVRGERIKFDLTVDGKKTDNVYIGRNAVEVERDNIVFDVDK